MDLKICDKNHPFLKVPSLGEYEQHAFFLPPGEDDTEDDTDYNTSDDTTSNDTTHYHTQVLDDSVEWLKIEQLK
jgi:hypothetical protein